MRVDAPPESARHPDRRRSIGVVLIGVGVLGILWGVFHVLESVPRPERIDFAHRVTDYQARSAVHGSFFGGLLRSLCGLALAMFGGWLRSSASSRAQ
jgi:hypothetical protein